MIAKALAGLVLMCSACFMLWWQQWRQIDPEDTGVVGDSPVSRERKKMSCAACHDPVFQNSVARRRVELMTRKMGAQEAKYILRADRAKRKV